MTKPPESPDPDTPKVLEVLRAARRSARDPDYGLAEMLSELARPSSQLDAQEVLSRLASDVGTD